MLWIINWNLKLPAGTFINSKSMWCDDQIIDNKHQNKNQDGLPTWDSSNCFVVNWLTSSSVFDVPTHPTISSISATCLWEDTKTFYIKKQMMPLIVPFPDAKHRKVTVFRVFLVRIITHLDWIRRDTEHLSLFTPNAIKYEPETLRIQIRIRIWCGF